MIAALLLLAAQPGATADAAPTAQDARAAETMDAYVACLRRESGPPPVERSVADEQARVASRRCQAPRSAMIEAFIPLIPATMATSEAKQQEAERGAALLDSAFAHSLTLKPVRIVPVQPEDRLTDAPN
jgi:hypothetical protein